MMSDTATALTILGLSPFAVYLFIRWDRRHEAKDIERLEAEIAEIESHNPKGNK